MVALRKMIGRVSGAYSNACISVSCASDKAKICAVFSALMIVSVLSPEDAQAQQQFGAACNKLLGLIEGAFGALIAAAAGVAAIVAAALGGFKMAWSLVVVSIGSFILRSYISIFNGQC